MQTLFSFACKTSKYPNISEKMKVIVDDKIPYIREALTTLVDEAIFLPASQIDKAQVQDVDALIIRTRTRCNEDLLKGSKVKFIATATIGYDHIDTDYCAKAGISWTNAPGCNASSVAQYVHACLLLLLREKEFTLKGKFIGIIGVGNVGRKVAKIAEQLGMQVLLNDPPRQAVEGDEGFASLQQIAEVCDVITFHTPLNKIGVYKTFHLADEAFFQKLKKKPILINTSRGEVVDGQALSDALNKGLITDAIIDVWEGEPDIDTTLLNKVFVGTPHIAGYSADGKANATRMSLDALCRHFHLKGDYQINPPMPTDRQKEVDYLQIYNPMTDSLALKNHPEQFEQLRGNYPIRREPDAYGLKWID